MVLLKFDDIPLSVIVVRKFFKKILNVSFLYFSRLWRWVRHIRGPCLRRLPPANVRSWNRRRNIRSPAGALTRSRRLSMQAIRKCSTFCRVDHTCRLFLAFRCRSVDGKSSSLYHVTHVTCTDTCRRSPTSITRRASCNRRCWLPVGRRTSPCRRAACRIHIRLWRLCTRHHKWSLLWRQSRCRRRQRPRRKRLGGASLNRRTSSTKCPTRSCSDRGKQATRIYRHSYTTSNLSNQQDVVDVVGVQTAKTHPTTILARRRCTFVIFRDVKKYTEKQVT